jgi:hypothetical protein
MTADPVPYAAIVLLALAALMAMETAFALTQNHPSPTRVKKRQIEELEKIC